MATEAVVTTGMVTMPIRHSRLAEDTASSRNRVTVNLQDMASSNRVGMVSRNKRDTANRRPMISSMDTDNSRDTVSSKAMASSITSSSQMHTLRLPMAVPTHTRCRRSQQVLVT